MEPELTLERAVTLARQSECVKTQQPTVRGELFQESTIEVVRGRMQSKTQSRTPGTQTNPPFQRAKVCGRCGKPGPHSQLQCPPRDSICHKCGKIGA